MAQQPKTAPDLCQRAADIMNQRAAQYDAPDGERSAGKAAIAFNAITGHNLCAAEIYLILQILKDVRQWQTPGVIHRDSVEDKVSYSALCGEAILQNWREPT